MLHNIVIDFEEAFGCCTYHVYLDPHKDALTKAEQDRLAMPPPIMGNHVSDSGTTKQDGKNYNI